MNNLFMSTGMWWQHNERVLNSQEILYKYKSCYLTTITKTEALSLPQRPYTTRKVFGKTVKPKIV